MIASASRQSPSKTTSKSARWVAGLLLFLPLAARAEKSFHGPTASPLMAEPRNREASGLAASLRVPDVIWTHNDSGGEPVLFALSASTGDLRGKVRLEGVKNIDWEDLASFVLDGVAYLLVADVGDNRASRKQVVLHVVPEPDAAQLNPFIEHTVKPAYSIPFIYEDLARDCESVAVDPREKLVYLLSKRDAVPRLYRLPLAPATAAKPATARFVGPIELPPNESFFLGKTARWPTAMDFAPDGSGALVLTYGGWYYYPRAAGEDWSQALQRLPIRLPVFVLPQAEAACFSRDGKSLFLCSENSLQLLRFDESSAANLP